MLVIAVVPFKEIIMCRRAFTLLELLVILAILAFIATIFLPMLVTTKSSAPDTNLKLATPLVKEFGPDWENAQTGDLVEFSTTGEMHVLMGVLPDRIRLHDGHPGHNDFVMDVQLHLPQRKPVLFKQDGAGFEEAMRRFIRQIAGVSAAQRLESSSDGSTPSE